jgi:lactoylglutathione lyase
VGNLTLVHTCLRVIDEQASIKFYEAIGFERQGRLQFASAYNVYLGLPGDGARLELTINLGREEKYDLGEGFGHLAVTVPSLDETLASLGSQGIEPEQSPYHPGDREDLPRIAFVRDPDGYRIELIDGGGFETPQDIPPRS